MCGRAIWIESADTPQVLVSDVMSTTLVTLSLEQTKADVLRRRSTLEAHHGFPVLSESGRLHGLLSLDELDHFGDDTPLSEIVDQAPCCIHTHWPVERVLHTLRQERFRPGATRLIPPLNPQRPRRPPRACCWWTTSLVCARRCRPTWKTKALM